MRTSYLTGYAFRRKAREIIREQQQTRGAAISITPTATALLVIDMQDYFLNADSHAYVPGAAQALAGIQDLIAAFRGAGSSIVFTRHLNTADDAGMLGKWWADVITRDSPLSKIHCALETGAGVVIEKSQYDAFHGTDLAERMRAAGVRCVVISGVITHLCCETTARAAFVNGFEVLFPIDATASYHPDFHLATLRNLSHGFARLTFVADLIAALESSS